MFFDDVGDFTLGSIVDVYFVWNFIGYSFLVNGFHREHGSIRPQKNKTEINKAHLLTLI